MSEWYEVRFFIRVENDAEAVALARVAVESLPLGTLYDGLYLAPAVRD